MAEDPAAERFLSEVERFALRMVPEPLRHVDRGSAPGHRELRYADAPDVRIVVDVRARKVSTGIRLEGDVGEKVFGNLKGSRELLEQTLGKGLEFKGKKGERWIGETIPLAAIDRRTAERVAQRVATYILYFKPMMDDLGSRA